MFSKSARLWLGVLLAISLLSLASACSGGPTPPPDETPSTAGPLPTGDGTITGTISYAGTAPEPKKLDASADAVCAKNADLMTEDWAVKDGKVANTFVYVKEGTVDGGKKISEYGAVTSSAPATLDQNGCHYKPHVFGVVVNQPVSIKNSDPTTHNVHFIPKNNPDWNQSQASGAPALSHKFGRAEVLVPVKCNQHPWMKAYVGVLKHTLFAVSSADGTFKITGVPAGKYTVVAWHEGPGAGTEKTMEVTVPAKGSATADYTFGASAELRGQPSSMPMMPAIEFPMIRR